MSENDILGIYFVGKWRKSGESDESGGSGSLIRKLGNRPSGQILEFQCLRQYAEHNPFTLSSHGTGLGVTSWNLMLG